jgi:hypothetical protein
MIKNRTVIEVEVNGRDFRLECAPEAVWEEVVKSVVMIHDFAQERIRINTEQIEAAKQAESEEKE